MGNWSRRSFLRTAASAGASSLLPAFGQNADEPVFVYVGSYTEGTLDRKGKGIYVFRLDPGSGNLEAVSTIVGVANPSFIALDSKRQFLYAVNEISDFEGGTTGSVTAFAVDPADGNLTLLNRRSSMGADPVHLSVDPTGRNLLVANFTGGNIAVFPILSDGSLGAPTDVVELKGPKQVQADPTGQFVIVNDLGLDKTLVFQLNGPEGKLIPHSELAAEPGAGPRQLAYHPLGRWVYRLNELNNTMTALEWVAATGELRNIQSLSTLPEDFKGQNATAQVLVAPYGKYVYGSNRGRNTITLFHMEAATGEMTFKGERETQGDAPSSFAIDPNGDFLFAANEASDEIVGFRIDRETGELSPTEMKLQATTPVNVTIAAPQVGVTSKPGVSVSVFTNPVYITDGTSNTRASFAWNAPSVRQVDVRVNAPDGASLGLFANAFGVTTEKWVTDGTVFYLQEAGRPLTRDNTLGTVTIIVRDRI
jgi:6-phosphogluconolactonase